MKPRFINSPSAEMEQTPDYNQLEQRREIAEKMAARGFASPLGGAGPQTPEEAAEAFGREMFRLHGKDWPAMIGLATRSAMKAERDAIAAADKVEGREERGPEVWLIHKNGRGWYRPNAQGYTNAVSEAGCYSYADAMRHSHPNGPEGPRDGMKIKHIENVLQDEAAAIRALKEETP